jgi:hypothetical protein
MMVRHVMVHGDEESPCWFVLYWPVVLISYFRNGVGGREKEEGGKAGLFLVVSSASFGEEFGPFAGAAGEESVGFEDPDDDADGENGEDGEREKEVRALLKTLDKEKVFIAREVIEGMVRAIDAMLLKEQQERSLITLNPEWDKMLNV